MPAFTEKDLRPYLKTALSTFRNKFHKHLGTQPFKGRFVFPCGSGKTSLESFIMRDMVNLPDGNRVHLVLAPRIVLVNQLMREYRKLIGSNYIALAFHSGRMEPDFNEVKWTEKSTTNPEFAAAELDRAHSIGKDLIIFSTYHSVSRLLPFKFHTFIADESQYCLDFFDVIPKINANIKLFFTATEKHNRRDATRNLNNKDIFGELIARGRVRDLINKKYLVPPRLHIMTATRKKSLDILTGADKEINSFVDETIRIARLQDGETRKTMPFSKILFACKGTEDVKIITERIEEIKKAMPTHRIFTIVSNRKYGCMINKQKMSRDDFMAELKKDVNALVFHYDILSEGIDVDGITGVAIMRNMGTAKLLQTIGRGIRIYKPNPKLKREALVSVPVINNDDDTKSLVSETILAMRSGGFEVNIEDILFNDERNPGIGLEEELDDQYDLSRRKKAQTLLENVFHELEEKKYTSYEYELKTKSLKDLINDMPTNKSNLRLTELSIKELYQRKNGITGYNIFSPFDICHTGAKYLRYKQKRHLCYILQYRVYSCSNSQEQYQSI